MGTLYTRRGYRQYSPSFEFSQRPRGHEWIRQLAFGVELDLQTDMENRWLTREIELNLLNLDTHSRESLQFEVTPGYERLTREFRVHPGVVLPSGEEYKLPSLPGGRVDVIQPGFVDSCPLRVGRILLRTSQGSVD